MHHNLCSPYGTFGLFPMIPLYHKLFCLDMIIVPLQAQKGMLSKSPHVIQDQWLELDLHFEFRFSKI